MARRQTAKSASETPSTTQTTRRRLTDADREKIRELAAEGKSVLINDKIGKTELRKGSLSF